MTKPRTRILALLAMSTLVLGALAAPTLAQEDAERPEEYEDDPAYDRAGDRPGRDARPDHASAAERCRDAYNETGEVPEKCRKAKQVRDAVHHLAERCRAAYNETGEVPEACKRAKALHDLAVRCRDAYEEDGEVPEACKKAKDVYDGAHKARRAAHAILKAIDAMEHRVVRLEMREVAILERIEEGNLTDEEAEQAEHRLERIQDAQNRTLERIEHLQERLEKIKERWEAAKDHARDYLRDRASEDDDLDADDAYDETAAGDDPADDAGDADE